MYYVRAYASNEFGTSYGNQVSFTTKDESSGNIIDGDGNIYTSITIGTQEWLSENLKTTSYLNGDDIGTTPVFTTDISGETNPKYQWAYDGDTNNVSVYGRLYTWYALKDSRGVCPVGWHVATDADWNTLITYLGGDSIAGGKLKEAGTSHWFSPNTNADNSSGFNALPAGSRMGGDLGYTGIWWSATERISTAAWWYKTFYNEARTNRSSMGKSSGLSCRCVKD
ncbi:MAG: hypothetical protein A2046_16910 [Bacteroidetes bacterium GWA2_30_7]|nr:MAG: hypothetical protein A2046_16910 [Bacteroidetes bacterium GWA2_30_7]